MTNTRAERGWLGWLDEDPIPWLLAEDAPAVRAAALQRLLDRPPDDPDVLEARAAAMRVDPIRAILDAQDPAGWWDRPGPGYRQSYEPLALAVRQRSRDRYSSGRRPGVHRQDVPEVSRERLSAALASRGIHHLD